MPLNASVCKRYRRHRQFGIDLPSKTPPEIALEAFGVFVKSSTGRKMTAKTSWPAGGSQRPARRSGTACENGRSAGGISGPRAKKGTGPGLNHSGTFDRRPCIGS
jgi:hypothetical protein